MQKAARDILKRNLNGEHSQDSERIESYLKQLEEEDNGFDFRIAKAPDGSAIR
jgi:hypothetical protein